MKCFLSHSSKDKMSYVRQVANRLSPRIAYDEYTFEEGLPTFDEIMSGINESELFVLFISDDSLNSEWVKAEILEAERKLSEGQVFRFLPIIIDKRINHEDPRIPSWISASYNLRPITRPNHAARRIRQQLIEISWEQHPKLKEKSSIFVGRNEIIKKVEERIDDIKRDMPKCIFSSGIKYIGRKSTIIHALKKSNVIKESYDPIKISLSQEDGLEGFILKLMDVGVHEYEFSLDLIDTSISKKIDIAVDLLDGINKSKEIIVVEDDKCITRFEQNIAEWFVSICDKLPRNEIYLCVASFFRPNPSPYFKNDDLFFLSVPELDESERFGLFRRYLNILDVRLSKEAMLNFSSVLSGYPEQVTYAADMIDQVGVDVAWRDSDSIRNFSIYKASIYVEKYKDDDQKMSLLRFMSSYEFLSIDFLENLSAKINPNFIGYVNSFVGDSICERFGSSSEYLRVNNVIRDYINRNNIKIEDRFEVFLKDFASEFVKNFDSDDFDVSEYYIAVKEILIDKSEEIPSRMLIPAHFLQAMKDQYNNRNYREVITLADRLLQKSINYEDHTKQDALYYLCQSLARLRDKRFLEEVQKIHGPEHDFLFGFYYRLQGKHRQAIERLEKSKSFPRTEQRARREIVLSLTATEAYEEAYELANENYQKYKANPFICQAYFNCVIHSNNDDLKREKLQGALDNMRNISGPKAEEMLKSMLGQFVYYCDKDFERAIDILDEGIAQFQDSDYPLRTKLEIATAAQNMDVIRQSLSTIKARSGSKSTHKLAIAKSEAILAALDGSADRANEIIVTTMTELHPNAVERLRRRIAAISDSQ